MVQRIARRVHVEYSSRMRIALSLVMLIILAGCSQPNVDAPPPSEGSLFNASAMRIHPIFSQIKDWTGDEKPDGFEVLLEFQDQFGDPTKAAGTVMFELFDYRQAYADPRGARLANPWIGSLATLDEQKAIWNRTSRTYTFQLSFPQVDIYKGYVLTALFRSSDGKRFFDRVVFEAQEKPNKYA